MVENGDEAIDMQIELCMKQAGPWHQTSVCGGTEYRFIQRKCGTKVNSLAPPPKDTPTPFASSFEVIILMKNY